MPSTHYFEDLYGVTEEQALNFWAANLHETIGTEQWARISDSTGVYLAMKTGFWAADAVDACLRAPQKAPGILRRYDATMNRALGAFTWFIYRIREPAMRNLFMSPRNWFRVEEAVLSLLAGGIFEGWPVRLRLYMFRGLYYITKFSQLRFHRARAQDNVAAGAPRETS